MGGIDPEKLYGAILTLAIVASMLVQRVFQICLFSLCLFVSKQILISKSPLAPFASFVYTIQAKGIVLEHQNVTGPGWCKTLEYRYLMLGLDNITFSSSSCSFAFYDLYAPQFSP